MPLYGPRGNCLGHKISSKGIKVDKAKLMLLRNYLILSMLRVFEAFSSMWGSIDGLSRVFLDIQTLMQFVEQVHSFQI